MPKELKKPNPHTFDGEINKVEEVNTFLLGMKKYFWVHDCFGNMKADIAIFSLKGKNYIWWEDLRNVKDIKENEISWIMLEEYFREKFYERYFDNKGKEFN